MADAEMVSYIQEVSETVGLPATSLQFVVAGKDAFHDVQARMNVGETTAERFSKAGIPMMPADTSRISGLKNFREMTAWKKVGRQKDPRTGKEIVIPGLPRFAWIETESNVRAYEQCANMVLDPDRPEDVLKIDADDKGEGGDDDYDQHRYALQSRAKATAPTQTEVGEDQQRPIDWKKREIRPRRPNPAVLAGEEDDDLRVPFRVPRTAQGRWRVPRYGVEPDPNPDEDLE